jgi:hypothetical protein
MLIKFQKGHKILIIGMIFISLIGCKYHTPSDNEVDKSPFTGIPCQAPCWQGLIVNESSESDVKSVLSTLTFIKQDSIIFHEMLLPSAANNTYTLGVEIYADCVYTKDECLRLRVVNDTLLEINITLNYEITLSEAILYLNNPDFIGYEDAGTEQISCQILILWENNQIILKSKRFYGLNEYEDNCERINKTNTISNILISEVSYQTVNDIEFLLSSDVYQFKTFSEILVEE